MAKPSRNRRAGVLNIQVNGTVYDAVGNFSYNLGVPMNEELVGPSGVQGFKQMPQVPYIEGEIRDAQDLNLEDILTLEDATITLIVANGKTIMLSEAFFSSEGTVQTEEANIAVKFCGISAEEIPA